MPTPKAVVHRFTAVDRHLLLALLASAALSGCGGGGGGSKAAEPAGILQFASSSSAVAEVAGGATIEVQVTRTGGSAGIVSVVVDRQGTATAGTDFNLSTTSVTFAAGDTAAKTLTIAVADDAEGEPDETVALTLVSPTGGATLGTNSSVQITIADNDPPAAPTLAAVDATMKQLHFSWQTVPGATSYQLLQSTDSGATSERVGAALPAGATSATVDVSVHSFNWLKTAYRIEACIAERCASSQSVGVFAEMLNAIGFTAAHNPSDGDNFGLAIALSNDENTLAVGAPAEDSNLVGVHDPLEPGNELAAESGAVYVFARQQGSWVPQAFIKTANTGKNDRFGSSVSLSDDGTRLAVGAPRERSGLPGAIDAGAAYVFERTGSQWAQEARVTAVAPAPAEADTFGFSVAISGTGTTLAVGAPGQDSLGASGGAVYVFTVNAGLWQQQDFLKAFNAEADDAFGSTVSLSRDGNRLAVGAPGEDSIAEPDDEAGINIGAVYVFRRLETIWSHEPAYLKSGNDDTNTNMGRSLALSRDGATLVAGAPGSNLGGADSGEAYIFVLTGNQWSLQAGLSAFNADAGDKFGTAVAISADGNVVAIGAPHESSPALGIGGLAESNVAVDAGAAYVFKRSGTTWSAVATYVKSSSTDASDQFGSALALGDHGDTLAIGAPLENGGAVYSY